MVSTAFTQKADIALKALILCQLPPNTQLMLFGSRARGTAKWNADYDVLIKPEQPIEISSRTIDDIRSVIDESWIPFNVDLITISQCKGVFGKQVMLDAKPW